MKKLSKRTWEEEWMLLELQNINAFYGSFQALEGVSLSVDRGQIVTLLGGNASGKSTTLKSILGMVRYSGTILLDGNQIDKLPTWKRVAKGVAIVPEGRRIFPNMTIRENLLLSLKSDTELSDRRDILDGLFALFPVLCRQFDSLASGLSGGEQQMLAIARSLAMKPRVLLMDEPSMGLSPDLVRRHCEVVEEVAQRGVGIILVEQHANIAMTIADHAYILRQGRVIMKGDSRELASNDIFRKGYLGRN